MAFPVPIPYSMRLRLYFGAAYTNQTRGMYSFVPAKPYKGDDIGFPRIIIKKINQIQQTILPKDIK